MGDTVDPQDTVDSLTSRGDTCLSMASTVTTSHCETRRNVDDLKQPPTVPTSIPAEGETRRKVEEMADLDKVTTPDGTRRNDRDGTHTPSTVPTMLPSSAVAGGKVDWRERESPLDERAWQSAGIPHGRGGEEVYGDLSSASHNSPMKDDYGTSNWKNETWNDSTRLNIQDNLEISGARARSMGQPSEMPGCFSQMGDVPPSFNHPFVTQRKKGAPPQVNGSLTSIDEEEIRQNDIRMRQETERKFNEMMKNSSTPMSSFQMSQPTPHEDASPLKEQPFPSLPILQLTNGANNLNLDGHSPMEGVRTEVYWEEWLKRRMFRLSGRMVDCISSMESKKREEVIEDIRAICDDEREVLVERITSDRDAIVRENEKRTTEMTRERDDIYRQWYIEKDLKDSWLRELNQVMLSLGVKSNVKEIHRQIAHIQAESTQYRELSERMMAQMQTLQRDMASKMMEQQQMFNEQQNKLLEQLRGEQMKNQRHQMGNGNQMMNGINRVHEQARPPRSPISPLPIPSSLSMNQQQSEIQRDGRWERSASPSELSYPLSEREFDNDEYGNNKARVHQQQQQLITENGLFLQMMGGAFIQLKPFDYKVERFDEFMERFNIKYRGYSERDKVIMMGSALGASETVPMKVFRSLPEEIRIGSDLDRVVREMRRALDKNSELTKQKAQQKLDELSGKGEVTYICQEIEQLVGLGMPYIKGDAKDKFMKDKFVTTMRARPEYDKIYEVYCQEGTKFEDLRHAAMRAEYIEQTKRNDKEKERTVPKRDGDSVMCHSCGRKGHVMKDCRNPNKFNKDNGGGYKGINYVNGVQPRKAYENTPSMQPNNTNGGNNQGNTFNSGGNKYGGNQYSNNYNNGNRPFNSKNGFTNRSNGIPPHNPSNSNNARASEVQIQKDESIGKSEKDGIRVKDPREEAEGVTFVGSRLHTMMRVEGVTQEVLVDSGAQVSLIPKSILNQILSSNGVNWNDFYNNRVQMAETNLRIMGASKTVMKLCGKSILQIQVNNESEPKAVGFYITDCDQDEVLLGVNAFKTLNVKITLGMDTTERREEKEIDKKAIATVVKSLSLYPGEVSTLTVSGPESTECILWSQKREIDSGMCVLDENGHTDIPLANTSDTVYKFMRGELIGQWNSDRIKEKLNEIIEGRVEYVSMEKEVRTREERITDILKHLEQEKGEKLSTPMRILISDHEDVFALNDDELGKSTVVEHSIDTGDSKPIKQRPRPVPYTLREPLQKLLNSMEETGIIRPSTSPWASPVVLVKKKDGSIRLCIDYRKLNEVIKTDAYPLPRINDCVQELRGKRLFSTLDLKSGFWQIGLEENSIEKTAFSTLDTHYEFIKLPFGLCTSPAVFQRTMNIILKSELQKPMGQRDVFCYIDDILIATADEDSHLRAMERVLTLLREGNMRLNVKKCLLEKQQVHYLGHTIDGSGVSIQKDKVKAVAEFPRPDCLTKLRTFLGMTGYNRKFINNYAAITQPLYALTSTKRAWSWSKAEEDSFNTLKEKMCTAPVLAQPNHEASVSGEAPFIITTDACIDGIGAVLSQKGADGEERPLQYYSRTLKPAERNYGITDLEGLAVYEGVNKFRHYILGTTCIVRTDHQPLISMFRRLNLSPRVMRWAELLQSYRIQMEYIQGTSNNVADALSRGALESETTHSDGAPWESIVNVVRTRTMEKHENWEEEYINDEWCKMLMSEWADLDVDQRSKKEMDVPDSRKKINMNDIRVENGYLLIQDEKHRWKIYVPEGMRQSVMKDEHEGLGGGHFGSYKIIPKMETRYYWGALRRDVPKYIRTCKTCAIVNPKPILNPPLTPFLPSRPLEIVGIDLCDVGRSVKGNRYILTIIDHFTKFASAYALRDKTAEAVARALVDEWMLREGRIMEQLLSDQGREFDNTIMNLVSELLGIERIFTLGYDSRRNGLTERMNRTITTVIKKLVMDGKSKGSWDDLLPFAVFAYNSTPHTTTGYSPYFLMNGREPRHISKIYPKSLYCLNDDYSEILKEGLRDIYSEVQLEIKRDGERNKTVFDKNTMKRSELPSVGELVYMRIPTEKRGSKMPKLTNEWKGPYRVIKVGKSSATIVNTKNDKDKIRVQYKFLKKVSDEVTNPEVDTIRNRREMRVASIQVMMNTHCRIGMRHPLHMDFICPQCKPPFNQSIRQSILAARTKQVNKHGGFDALVQRAQLGKIPFTKDEVTRGYGKLCAHRSVALAEATEDIQYEGESGHLQESVLIGSIIRQIVIEAGLRLKKDFAFVPKDAYEVAAEYLVELPAGDTPLTDQVNALRSLIPGRLLILVPRKMELTDWGLIKSVLFYLACRGWQVCVAQSPPSLSSSKTHYEKVDALLSTMLQEVDSMGEDIKNRVKVATHAKHLYKGYWPMALAAAHDWRAIFDWFEATPANTEVEEEEMEEHRYEDMKETGYGPNQVSNSRGRGTATMGTPGTHSHPHTHSYSIPKYGTGVYKRGGYNQNPRGRGQARGSHGPNKSRGFTHKKWK